MNELLDDIARIIASSVSRRQAIRLVSRAVGGAVLTSFGRTSPQGVGGAGGYLPPGFIPLHQRQHFHMLQ